jgi:hypothetical protein
MTFQGHIENGMVVVNEPLPLPDGTPVLVEAVATSTDFWKARSLDELAELQGVAALQSPDAMVGGWPADELNDNFEEQR